MRGQISIFSKKRVGNGESLHEKRNGTLEPIFLKEDCLFKLTTQCDALNFSLLRLKRKRLSDKEHGEN